MAGYSYFHLVGTPGFKIDLDIDQTPRTTPDIQGYSTTLVFYTEAPVSLRIKDVNSTDSIVVKSVYTDTYHYNHYRVTIPLTGSSNSLQSISCFDPLTRKISPFTITLYPTTAAGHYLVAYNSSGGDIKLPIYYVLPVPDTGGSISNLGSNNYTFNFPGNTVGGFTATPKGDNYEFDHWELLDSTGVVNQISNKSTISITYNSNQDQWSWRAVFKAKYYTITFDKGDTGSTYDTLSGFSPKQTDENGSVSLGFSTPPFTKPDVINQGYSVTFDPNGGLIDNNPNPKVVDQWNTTTYRLEGWSKDPSGSSLNYYPRTYQFTSDTTLYPYFTSTLSKGTISNIIPTKEGYSFRGWFTSTSGGIQIKFPYTPTSNITLYAQWSEDNIPYAILNGGYINGSSSDYQGELTEYKPEGINLRVYRFPIPTKNNSKFLGWKVTKLSGTIIVCYDTSHLIDRTFYNDVSIDNFYEYTDTDLHYDSDGYIYFGVDESNGILEITAQWENLGQFINQYKDQSWQQLAQVFRWDGSSWVDDSVIKIKDNSGWT